MEEKEGIRPHSCQVQNRSSVRLTGIREVVSFDEQQAVMDTDMGLLTIKGKDLHVSRLTVEQGEVDLEGTVDSLVYSSNEAYRKLSLIQISEPTRLLSISCLNKLSGA